MYDVWLCPEFAALYLVDNSLDVRNNQFLYAVYTDFELKVLTIRLKNFNHSLIRPAPIVTMYINRLHRREKAKQYLPYYISAGGK